MIIRSTFHIRRYWLEKETPEDVLKTLNHRWGLQPNTAHLITPYVDINYHGEGDKLLTMMELKCSDWITNREEITYTVEGDDGL